MTKSRSVIGDTISTYRKIKNLTQSQLGEILNKPQANVSQYERLPYNQFDTWFQLISDMDCKVHIKVETKDGELILEINQ